MENYVATIHHNLHGLQDKLNAVHAAIVKHKKEYGEKDESPVEKSINSIFAQVESVVVAAHSQTSPIIPPLPGTPAVGVAANPVLTRKHSILGHQLNSFGQRVNKENQVVDRDGNVI